MYFDDFDLEVTCEEYYEEEWYEDDDYDLEMGFDPYSGCYDWDC